MVTASSTSSPRVSIGLPVYNGSDYLEAALDSIQAQTFTDFELIICDNGSTDGTEIICRRYAEQDDRIRYVRNPRNLGAAKNYNRTLELAEAPYFRWACHDDRLAPRCLEACVEVLDAHPNVVCAYPLTQMIDAEGNEIEEPGWVRHLHLVDQSASERFSDYLRAYLWGGDGGQLFGLMRTDVLRSTMQHGDFPSADLILIGDLTLWGDLYEVPERLFLRRLHDENSIYGNDQEIDKVWAWFDPDQKGQIRWLEWRWLKELTQAIGRAPLSGSERRRCYQALARLYVRHHGRKCVKEVLYVLSVKSGIVSKKRAQKVVGLNTMYKIL